MTAFHDLAMNAITGELSPFEMHKGRADRASRCGLTPVAIAADLGSMGRPAKENGYARP